MEYNELIKVGQASNKGSQAGTVYSSQGIFPTLAACTHGYALGYVLVTQKTPTLYICQGCDKMYVWINNALNVLPENLYPTSIMTEGTKTENTHRVRSVAKKPPTGQSSKSGKPNKPTMPSIEIALQEETQE